jgi:peptidoglycan/xylan/chitin deacetylase (PgdA/CDA1 family)
MNSAFRFARQVKRALTGFNRRGVILTYHRVAQPASDPWQLCVSPEHFAEQMEVIARCGLPVALPQMQRNLKRFSVGRKEIAITFDDGYADNLHNAAPILVRYGMPAIFFVVSGALDSRKEFWWDELERLILSPAALPETFDVAMDGVRYCYRIVSKQGAPTREYGQDITDMPPANAELSRLELYYVLSKIISSLASEPKNTALRQISLWANQSPQARSDYLPLAVKDLISLAQNPLFEIGAHTVSHPKLSGLSTVEQETEITRGKRELESILGRPITSFSYPHGSYSDVTVEIVRRARLQVACTIEGRPVSRSDDPFVLPRIIVSNWSGDLFEERLRRWLA